MHDKIYKKYIFEQESISKGDLEILSIIYNSAYDNTLDTEAENRPDFEGREKEFRSNLRSALDDYWKELSIPYNKALEWLITKANKEGL